MKLKTLTAAVLAVLLVSAGAFGAAATPGNAPDKTQDDEHANEAAADEAAEDGKPAVTGTDRADEKRSAPAKASEDRRGPPTEMPEQVPDFVTKIHQKIIELDGGLGEVISDLTPGDDEADSANETASEDTTETPESTETPEDEPTPTPANETTTAETDA